MGGYSYEHYMDHVPDTITEEIEQYVDDVVLKKSRYLFITRKGKEHYAYCTHCKKEIKIDFKVKHNSTELCSSCGSECTVKYAGYSRTTMTDKACYLRFDKSLIDKNIVIARGYFVYRDYAGEYKNVKTQYNLVSVYIFTPGSASVMLDRYSWWYKYRNKNECWDKRGTIHLFTSGKYGYGNLYTDKLSLNLASKGTVFEYMDFNRYINYSWDLIRIIGIYSQYPLIIEHLTKLGLDELIDARIYRYNTYSSVNWKGKDIYKALKINKQDFNILRKSGIKITPLILKLYQIQKKDGSKLSPEELSVISNTIKDPCAFIKILKYGSLKKMYNYLYKQQNDKRLQSYYSILGTYRDYISDCEKLDMDLNNKNVLFPKNLVKAHEETIKRVKYKEDKALNERFTTRYKTANEKYYFEYKNMLIRAVRNSAEIIKEGEKLHHCIARYSEEHASGKTTILLIRNKEHPKTPFFTVEVKGNKIIQAHGKYNCNPEGEVEEFIEKFKSEKLEISKKVKLTA